MSEEHKTLQLNQGEIILGHIAQVASQVSAGRAESAAHRAESAKRGIETDASIKQVKADIGLVHNEVVRLSGRVGGVETELVDVKTDLHAVKVRVIEVAEKVDSHDSAIRKLTDADIQLTQHVSSADLDREAEMAAIIVRQREADAARTEHEDKIKEAMSEHEKRVEARQLENERVNRAVLGQLGIDYDKVAKPGSVPPPANGKPVSEPTPALKKLAIENKATLYIAAAVAAYGALKEMGIFDLFHSVFSHH